MSSDPRFRAFQRDRAIVVSSPAEWSDTLEGQFRRIADSDLADRPWLYWELHNPFSRAAAVVDSWQILDFCQSPQLVARLAGLIGEDIVLFDSQFVPNPALREFDVPCWRNDAGFFPLDPATGIVARLPFGNDRVRTVDIRRDEPVSIEYRAGEMLLHAADVEYRSSAGNNSGDTELVVRYFPSTLRFQRDPGHPKHRLLTERYPWINYTKMPLWLVRGEDRAGNDFVTGFHTRIGRFTPAQLD